MKYKSITPEPIIDGGRTTIIDTQCDVITLDPRKGVKITSYYGFIDGKGEFVSCKEEITKGIDKASIIELTDDTTGGKKAGDYKISDVFAKVKAVYDLNAQLQENARLQREALKDSKSLQA